MLTIENAKPKDAEAILRLKRDAWLQTYPNKEQGVTLNDIKKNFTVLDLEDGIKNWQKAIAIERIDGDHMTFVAKEDGKVIGYTSPHITEGKKWLGAMYVAPKFQGMGAGGALLKRAIKWHGSNAEIYLNVVSYNDKAIKFYEHFGFKKTGNGLPKEFNEEKGIKLLPEIEMVLKTS